MTAHFLKLLARWRAGLSDRPWTRFVPRAEGDRWDVPAMSRMERFQVGLLCLAVGGVLAVGQIGCFAFAFILLWPPLRFLLVVASIAMTALAGMALLSGLYLLARVIR